jgi:hypothetical protein
MTLDDITYIFAYRRDKLPHLDELVRSHNLAVSGAIVDCFVGYGWSISGLLDSHTKVMKILKHYFSHKRPHADSRLESEFKNKRWRVDRSGASGSLLDQLSPGSNDFGQAIPSTTYNNMESTLGSNSIHVIPFDGKNGTRHLIDPAIGNLGCAVNSPDEFTDHAAAGNLGYAVNRYEITDLANCEPYHRENNVEDTAISLPSQHPRSQDQLASTNTYTVFDPSYNRHCISLEATFNKSTYPRYIVPYDSPIFICVQLRDIHGARALFQEGTASIYDVDPYNLGLLYVSKSIQPIWSHN